MLAALGRIKEAETLFETNDDVARGGLFCALPALAANGLFRKLPERLPSLTGFYGTVHILIVVSYMLLARLKNPERLNREAPGEFGKLLGLDRIPEARCLRKKLTLLSEGGTATTWQEQLSKEWLEGSEEAAGFMYVDGHVQVYHGKLSKLPRKYLSRERLCMHGISNYWVNDIYGRPVFVVPKSVNPGLLTVLREDIVPRLMQEVPRQPSAAALANDPTLPRFIIIFDREGYSPKFFREMWEEHRVACISYHKHPGEDWAIDEFEKETIEMATGEDVDLHLAERGTLLGGDSPSSKVWVREIRKLTKTGHQTSIISTAYNSFGWRDAGLLLSRWSQENFFGYMMQNFGIDRLAEYGVQDFSETMSVINPKWRQQQKDLSKLKSKIQYRQSKLGKLVPPDFHFDQKAVNQGVKLQEEIDYLQYDMDTIKEKQKKTPHYITWGELEDGERFHQLRPDKKQLMDTIKMIAYRAETAISNTLRQSLSHSQESRTLARELFHTPANIRPDFENQELHIVLHRLSTKRSEKAVQHLLDSLNATEFTYPGTQLKLKYKFIGTE